MDHILKYPSTVHLEGSKLQAGDKDGTQIAYSAIVGKWIVVEEKMDGANSGIRFSPPGELFLQSRGHYLTGGGREKHFTMLKSWASAHENTLFKRLSDRFLMYGEWMASKHTIFYDQLPHYFLEFDLFDIQNHCFLSTDARRQVLDGSPVISVPVLYEGVAPKRLQDLLSMIRPSLGKTPQWRENLENVAKKHGLDVNRVMRETEETNLCEGLYIKVEKNGQTIDRLKWVRANFLQTMEQNDSHWLSRPIIPNQLAPGTDLFAEHPSVNWDQLPPSASNAIKVSP